MTALWRLTRRSSGAPWRQDRGSPAASQLQTVMESVLVLLRGGRLLSEITTGRRWSSRPRPRNPPGRVRMDAVLSGDQETEAQVHYCSFHAHRKRLGYQRYPCCL